MRSILYLRKNDLVRTEHGILPVKFTSFNDVYVTGKNGRTLYCKEVEGVEITEEILIKLGFTEAMFDYTIHTGEFYNGSIGILSIAGNTGKFQLQYEMKCTQTTIQYVHQLQQLYYLLIEKELIYET